MLVSRGACLSLMFGLALAGCATSSPDPSARCADRRLHEIQVIGSHNSYRVMPPASVLEGLERLRPGLRQKLEYTHPPLPTQLDLGLRLLELDFYADSLGGRYANPPSNSFLREGEPAPFSDAEIAMPGFKVMHIQGYDVYAHCLHLRDCLQQLRTWSDANPSHTLITVTLNVKEDRVFADLPEPEHFDEPTLDALDALLFEVFGRQRLLTPDDVRSARATLREAVLAGAWPKLAQTRQQFMFVLDEATPKASLIYRQWHPSLAGRAMFAAYPQDQAEAAFMVHWDITGREQTVRDLVAQGFLVRVSSDIGTKEARSNDRSRLEAAIRSGAQFVATDYYPGNTSPFTTNYVATFADGEITRCAR